MRFSRFAFLASLTLAMPCTSTLVKAQPNDVIGRVLQTRNPVEAVTSSGSRTLQRRSEIFNSDSIVTGPDSFIMLRMIDGAQVSIREDSEFHFTEYQFDGDPHTPDMASMTLVRGGFRIITGSISDNPADTYLLSTLGVEITVNGTSYECAIELDKTYCGVTSGSITVKNPIGEIRLGLGGNWDYVEAGTQPDSLTPLLTRPATLMQIQANVQRANSAPSSAGQRVFNNAVTPRNTPAQTPSPTLPPAPAGNGASFPAPTPIQVVPTKQNTP